MTSSAGRPRKRQRSIVRDDGEGNFHRKPPWSQALDALLERLSSVRSESTALRDEKSGKSAAISENMVAAAVAAKAVARVSRQPPSQDVDIFSRGVRVDAECAQPDVPKVHPLPALKLLMELDPPEKLIHEQSIIVRAQAINRRNAELARERLPKQPEAQRNKTFHDYFLDEALWMASDFREERKWKMQMAKKISKMVLQYHSQRSQREVRAKAEVRNKLIKVANGIARDVRKFWRQIAEIADFRKSLIEEAKLAKMRASRLHHLLEKTASYSRVLAESLKDPSGRKEQTTGRTSERKVTFGTVQLQERKVQLVGNGALERTHNEARTGASPDVNSPDGTPEYVTDIVVEGLTAVDDESTMVAIEAEQERDACEIQNLKGEANMGVDELLRSQGIDPAAYKADQKNYLDVDEERSDIIVDSTNEDDVSSPDFLQGSDAVDDESTMKAAEEGEEQDKAEIGKLHAEADLDVEVILRSQGIDPAKYYADQKRYTRIVDEELVIDDVAMAPCRESKGEDATVELRSPGRSTEVFPIVSSSIVQDPSAAVATPEVGTEVLLNESVRKEPARVNGIDAVEKLRQVLPESSHSRPITQPAGLHFREPTELLRGNLRNYQSAGVAWLISLFSENLNGILADEMGLGKTIQAISLLAWLAVEKGVWGPHLIVVPTSVMVNWEVEFKKWLPGFKVLTYFGSLKERKQKRQGWTRPNSFHVCITSYNLAVQDSVVLRRKKWVYLILDEAHNIKNFQSQRWQTLLNFSSQRRLLITGTPLQNSVMELWSLMHFLMPEVFESHAEFKDWFSRPIAAANASDEIVIKLHEVLRPFLLRRLKADVERSLPPKFEHIIRCPLSKRQRQLYEDFMARTDIRDTLNTGDFFSVMNVLMQLRKVCNHPDLFEGRQILSPLSMKAIFYPVPTMITRVFEMPPEISINLDLLGLELCSLEVCWPGRWHSKEAIRISAEGDMHQDLLMQHSIHAGGGQEIEGTSTAHVVASNRASLFRRSQMRYFAQRTAMSIRRQALLGEDLRTACEMTPSSLLEALRFSGASAINFIPRECSGLVRKIDQVAEQCTSVSELFVSCVTRVCAPIVECRYRSDDRMYASLEELCMLFNRVSKPLQTVFRSYDVRSRVTIPDKRLVQWDCGKLQVLDRLLRKLRSSGSRVLIFTQMTKVLDILESFLNLHSWRYLRLDGTTKADDRQKVVERFNQDDRIFCMILTTRAGGVGLNLTGADAVVFYDTDYNPAVDNQAQDRAHRIGQTKPVNIYRLVSEQTVEENILRRANEKRVLEALVISDAGFTTESIAAQTKKSAADNNAPSVAVRDVVSEQRTNPNPVLPTVPTKNGITSASKGTASFEQRGMPIGRTPQAASPSICMPKSLQSAIETAYGQYVGPGTGVEGSPKTDARLIGHGQGPDMLQYQDVTSQLLAAEDDREEIAACTAKQEQDDLRAEFEETCSVANGRDVSDPTPGAPVGGSDGLSYDELESSLTPVQRYALRFIERWHAELNGINENVGRYQWHSQPAEKETSEVWKENEDTRARTFGVMSAPDHGYGAVENQPGRSDDDDDPLFYEVDLTDNGTKSYLKALTDTDVDIKLYLPLRDGGPEELKVSSVVSGTAAAGLECAEDAAFFPHAYNRMSRTIYSTYRQKEKARANLRKRKAEKEARKKREVDIASAAIQREKELAIASLAANAARQIAVPERQKTKNKSDPSRNLGGPPLKKLRLDGSLKAKVVSGSGNAASACEGILAATSGLFRKSTKKSSRRLTLPGGRSAGTGSGTAMPGEGVGRNEGWTKNEDQKVIAAAMEYSNNMKLVADVLSLDVTVPAGVRRRRGDKHCLERLVNSLQKDVKSGPPLPRATESDDDVFRKHCEALVVAMKTVAKKPPIWISLPAIPTDWHPSQTKVSREAVSNASRKIQGSMAPTLSAVVRSIEVPAHFRIGFKSTETTPQALNRKKFPFLRPPRDDQRSGSQRSGSSAQRSGNPSRPQRAGSGPSSQAVSSLSSQRGGQAPQRGPAAPVRSGERHNGLAVGVGQGPGTSVIGKMVSRQSKGTASNSVPRPAAVQGRSIPAGRGASVKVRTAELPGGASRPALVQGQIPKALNVVPRKGVFVPGTGARMNICQVGGSIPSYVQPTQRSARTETKPEAPRKSAVGKVGVSPVQLKSGKIAGSSTRLPAVVGAGKTGSNGLKAAGERAVRNGAVCEATAVPGRASNLHSGKAKGTEIANDMPVRSTGTGNKTVAPKKNGVPSVGSRPPPKSTGGPMNKGGKKDL